MGIFGGEEAVFIPIGFLFENTYPTTVILTALLFILKFLLNYKIIFIGDVA